MTSSPDETPDKEQSMDDILASIRRIMLDEQARLQDGPSAHSDALQAAPRYPVPGSPADGPRGILVLDDSMVVSAVPAAMDFTHSPAAPVEVQPMEPTGIDMGFPVPRHAPTDIEATVKGASATPVVSDAITPQSLEALLAPAAAAAAAASVDALLRQLNNDDRLALLKPATNSPTIEEAVRAELRPMLKSWLDENLPSLVERLVRAELARLTGRPGI